MYNFLILYKILLYKEADSFINDKSSNVIKKQNLEGKDNIKLKFYKFLI